MMDHPSSGQSPAPNSRYPVYYDLVTPDPLLAYMVKTMDEWVHLDAGEIHYPGKTTVLGYYAYAEDAIAVAQQAKTATNEVWVYDTCHAGGVRPIYRDTTTHDTP